MGKQKQQTMNFDAESLFPGLIFFSPDNNSVTIFEPNNSKAEFARLWSQGKISGMTITESILFRFGFSKIDNLNYEKGSFKVTSSGDDFFYNGLRLPFVHVLQAVHYHLTDIKLAL